ncbi:hypothetical protein [Limobrevibacterium gyesilva]|nr:hypothetical protein [Limobrevibacterium gyesilva]
MPPLVHGARVRRGAGVTALVLLASACSVRPPEGRLVAGEIGPPLTRQDIDQEKQAQASRLHSSAVFAFFPPESLESSTLVRFRCSSGQWVGVYQDAAVVAGGPVPAKGTIALIQLGGQQRGDDMVEPHRVMGEVPASLAPRGMLWTAAPPPPETARTIQRNYDPQGSWYVVSCQPADLDQMRSAAR